MTTIQQNKQFLNEVLQRNYYIHLKSKYPSIYKDIGFILNNHHQQEHCFSSLDTELYNKNNFGTLENIEENLNALIQWYENNNFQCNIKIYNGDYLFDAKYAQLLDRLFLLSSQQISFYIDPILIKKDIFYTILDKYKQKIKIIFTINGKYCDDNKYDDSFYNLLFEILKAFPEIIKINSYITATNSCNWIINYKWIISQIGDLAYTNVHLNEYFNTDWTKEQIFEYTRFLDFQVDTLSQLLPNFPNFIFNNIHLDFNTIQLVQQNNINNKNNHLNCDFYKSLIIDVSSLGLLLCGKINYPAFYLGIFNKDTLDWDPVNPEMSIVKAHLKRTSTPHCEKCPIIDLCNGHCCGESFNYIYNPIIPLKENCDCKRAKYMFLLYKYNELNFLSKDILKYYIKDEKFLSYILTLKENIKDL